MANVVSISGYAIDPYGLPLAGKVVKLYNAANGSYLGGTYADVVTDSFGRFTFSGIDEALDVFAAVLAGGASSEQQRWYPFSGEARKLYVTEEMRFRSGAVARLPSDTQVGGVAPSLSTHNHDFAYSAVGHSHTNQITTATWTGNGTTAGRVVFSHPTSSGYRIAGALILEVGSAASVGVLLANQSYSVDSATGIYGDAAAVADAIADANANMTIRSNGANTELFIGVGNAGAGFNFNGSSYVAIIFLQPN